MAIHVPTSTTQARTLSADQAARGTERLKHLLPSLRECPKAREEAKIVIPAMTIPADPVWLMARIAALLLPYYEKDTPQAVREMEAEDWAAELQEFPRWAVDSAVRWWKGSDNPKRAKRPLEGDISARVKFEMQAVRAAKIALSSPLTDKDAEDEISDEPASPEARAKIMADLNFDPTAGGQLHKRMPGSKNT